MASKRRLRRKSCEGKIQFPDQPTAERAAWSHQRTYGAWMLAYKCRFCSHFHIGHPPRNVRAAILAKRQAKRGD